MKNRRKQGPFGTVKIESHQFTYTKQKKFSAKIIIFGIFIVLMFVSFFYSFSRFQQVTRLYDSNIFQKEWADYHNVIEQQRTVNILLVGENYKNIGKIGEKTTPLWYILSINPNQKKSVVVELSPLLSLSERQLLDLSLDKERNHIEQQLGALFDIRIHYLIKINFDEIRGFYNQLSAIEKTSLMSQTNELSKEIDAQIKSYFVGTYEENSQEWFEQHSKMMEVMTNYWLEEWYQLLLNPKFVGIEKVFQSSITYYQIVRLMTGDYHSAIQNNLKLSADYSNLRSVITKFKQNISD